MSENPTAIHVQTGDASWGGRIDAWVAEHGFAVERFTDAYAACARLVQSPAAVASLAFVGCDWLARDQHVLIERIRETWPACVVVAYARDASLLPPAAEAGQRERPESVRTIASEADLVRMLTAGPVALRERRPAPLRAAPPPTRVQPPERAPGAAGRLADPPQGVAGVLTAREIAILLGEAGR